MLASAVGQVCLTCKPHYALLCTCCVLLSCKIIFYACFFAAMLFPVLLLLFVLLRNRKISGAFILFVNFCTLHTVLICVVHIHLCVCSHFFLHFGFVCVIPYLSYFLQWFCAFVHSFLLPKCSLLHFLGFLQVFAGATSSFFIDFLPFCLPFR